MATAERRAPQTDPIVVDPGQGAGIGDGGGPVGKLHADVEQLARHTGAVAEVAVVERQAGVAGRAEAVGVGIQPHRAHRAQAVRHHQQRRVGFAVRPVQPRADALTGGVELDVLAVRHDSSVFAVFLRVRCRVRDHSEHHCLPWGISLWLTPA